MASSWSNVLQIIHQEVTNFDQAFEKIIMVLWTPWMATNDAFFNGKYRIAKVVLDHGLFIARVFFALQYASMCKLQAANRMDTSTI